MPMEDDLTTPGGVRIDGGALRVEFARSGGPGGQHVNTSATKVTLVLDVAAGAPEHLRQRLIDALGPEVRIVSSEHRSQWRNRVAARVRLANRIDDALVRERPRVATRPSRAANARRVDAKRRRSTIKSDRKVDPRRDH